MSSFEDWARSNKDTLLKFGKSRTNAQRELKKVLNDEQFSSAKKWFKQLGKASYTTALHEMWGDARGADDDHTDVSELVLESNATALQDAADKLHDVGDEGRTLHETAVESRDRTTDDPRVEEHRTNDGERPAQNKPFDIIASLKRTVDAMDANKPLNIYEKLRRIVEK